MDNGGNQQRCEASAIRQANAVVAANTSRMELYRAANPSYDVRYEDLDGRRHLVVPVVMMVEGVHNGSQGPVFHSAEELGRWENAWNGIAITIGHPRDEEGQYVSANEPERVVNFVGRVFHAHMDDSRLVAEAWLDEAKLQRVSPQALGYIRERRALEVSIGAFTDTDPQEGEWHEEHYEGVARNHRPDHLALLPGGRGACSWEDGCGIRAHEESVMKNRCDGCRDSEKACGHCEWANANASLKEAMKQTGPLCIYEQGYRECMMRLQAKLDEMDGNGRYHFLVEAGDDWLVYEVRREEGNSNLYRVEYSMNDDQVELSDERTEIRRRTTTEYVNANRKEVSEVTKAREKAVKALIANEQSKFTEEDTEWLGGLSDEQFAKLEPVEPQPQQNANENSNGITREQAVEVLREELSDPQKFMGLLPESVRGQMQHGLGMYESEKQALVERIMKATDVYQAEELQALEFNALKRMASAIVRPTYVGNGGNGNGLGAHEVAPLCPPGVSEE